MKPSLPTLLAILCLSSLLLVGFSQASEPKRELAPNWILTDSQGTQTSLYSDAQEGKTTVMVFWTSWCHKCREMLPQLNETGWGADINVYLMSVWESEDPVAYAEKLQLLQPLVLRADHVARRFNVYTTPAVFVVNPEKEIIYKSSPVTDVEATLNDLNALLSNPSKPAEPVDHAQEAETAQGVVSSEKSSSMSSGSTSSPSN